MKDKNNSKYGGMSGDDFFNDVLTPLVRKMMEDDLNNGRELKDEYVVLGEKIRVVEHD